MFSIIIIYAWLSVWILWTCEHTTHAARKRRGEKRKSRNKKRATSKTLQQQCVAAAGQDRLKLMCASAPLESAHTHSAIPPNSVYSRRIQHFVCSTPASLANTHFPQPQYILCCLTAALVLNALVHKIQFRLLRSVCDPLLTKRQILIFYLASVYCQVID